MQKLSERDVPDSWRLPLKSVQIIQKKAFFLRKRPFLFLWCQLESNQRHKDFQSFSCAVRTVTKTALIALNKRFYDFFLGYANLLCPFCALFLGFSSLCPVFFTPLNAGIFLLQSHFQFACQHPIYRYGN